VRWELTEREQAVWEHLQITESHGVQSQPAFGQLQVIGIAAMGVSATWVRTATTGLPRLPQR